MTASYSTSHVRKMTNNNTVQHSWKTSKSVGSKKCLR